MSEDFGEAMAKAAESDAESEPTGPLFNNVGEFVSEYLSQLYRRDLKDKEMRWCPEWWKHAEAIARLHALWRAWEVYRLDDGTGMSDWFLGHCDPQMRVLMSERGPFRHCRNDGHSADTRMPALLIVRPEDVGETRFWDAPTG